VNSWNTRKDGERREIRLIATSARDVGSGWAQVDVTLAETLILRQVEAPPLCSSELTSRTHDVRIPKILCFQAGLLQTAVQIEQISEKTIK
jgi:hypothetical protein